MATYSDWQQRQLDIAFSEQMDRRPLPVCFCKICGAKGHIWCNRQQFLDEECVNLGGPHTWEVK